MRQSGGAGAPRRAADKGIAATDGCGAGPGAVSSAQRKETTAGLIDEMMRLLEDGGGGASAHRHGGDRRDGRVQESPWCRAPPRSTKLLRSEAALHRSWMGHAHVHRGPSSATRRAADVRASCGRCSGPAPHPCIFPIRRSWVAGCDSCVSPVVALHPATTRKAMPQASINRKATLPPPAALDQMFQDSHPFSQSLPLHNRPPST